MPTAWRPAAHLDMRAKRCDDQQSSVGDGYKPKVIQLRGQTSDDAYDLWVESVLSLLHP